MPSWHLDDLSTVLYRNAAALNRSGASMPPDDVRELTKWVGVGPSLTQLPPGGMHAGSQSVRHTDMLVNKLVMQEMSGRRGCHQHRDSIGSHGS